jgi:hypothetical protein
VAHSGGDLSPEAYISKGRCPALAEFDGPRYKRLASIRQLLAAGTLSPDLRWTGEASPAAH